jgi:phosphopantothenoylcysteine synthetase/decarboxylase
VKNIHNKNIVVGITGSIAAYKAADLVSKLKKAGANIKVVMTKSQREPWNPFQIIKFWWMKMRMMNLFYI